MRRVWLVVVPALACARPAVHVAAPAPAPPAAEPQYSPCDLLEDAPKSDAARADVGRCRQAAEAADPRAAFVLSQALHDNPSLPGADEWRRWLERAVELGHPIAQYQVAVEILERPVGSMEMPNFRERGLQLLHDSACEDYPPAQATLRAMNRPLDPTTCPAPVLDIDGVWDGTLAITARQNDRGFKQEPITAHITIGAGTVRVEVRVRGAWQTVMADHFQVRRLRSMAVLHGIHEGWDNDGHWVESWVFTVTAVDHDHIRAVYQRVVNNNHSKRTSDHAVWWYAAAGDLTRATGTTTAKPATQLSSTAR